MSVITVHDLENAKLDVDHIAEVATSTAMTATDRNGNEKDTVAGAVYRIGGIENRGAWVTATAYAVKDIVSNSGTWYICVIAHTASASFGTDSPTKWRVYQGVTTGDLSASGGSGLVGFIEGGTDATAVTVQSRLRNEIWSNGFAGTATQKVQRAIDAAEADGGGLVLIPRGDLTLGDILIPANVIVRGQGQRATNIAYSGSGTFALLGGTDSAAYYGCGITDVAIVLSNNTAEAVRMKGTVGAEVARLYLEGYINAGRTNKGVVVDGSNASSYFNRISDVLCNHMENSFQMVTTGSSNCTVSYYDNCSAFGDSAGVGTASVGFYAAASQGDGTVFNGGNFERCGKGIHLISGRMTFIGSRFEPGSNTVDIEMGDTSQKACFIGLQGVQQSKIVDVVDTTYGGSLFIGCTNETFSSLNNLIVGTTTLRAKAVGDIPVKVVRSAGQTAKLISCQYQDGTEFFSVDKDGNVVSSGTVRVAGGSNPLIKAASALDSYGGVATGTLTNAPSAGNPDRWVEIDNAGTPMYVPAWFAP